MEYMKSYLNIEELKNNLKNKRGQEKIYKTSLYGIHKDDIRFLYNGEEASVYSSQGQKRMLMINVKFASLKLIESIKKGRIILLLDDILSELDKENRNKLLEELPNDSLVFITDANYIRLKKGYQRVVLS
jgi:DNA replication and repair protein RecF